MSQSVLRFRPRDLEQSEAKRFYRTAGGLTEADIQRMVREAESHASEDRRRREMVEARNEADALIYIAEKQLNENGGKAGESERRTLEQAVTALRDALSAEDIHRLRAQTQTTGLGRWTSSPPTF